MPTTTNNYDVKNNDPPKLERTVKDNPILNSLQVSNCLDHARNSHIFCVDPGGWKILESFLTGA